MSTSLVQTGIKFPDDTVLTSSIPVGATYVQFPGEPAPNSVFGGSWSAIFDNEGVFFRTPGGEASSFGGGIQSDQMQKITGDFVPNFGSRWDLRASTNGAFTPTNHGSAGADSVNGTAIRFFFDNADSPNARVSSTTSGETRARNRTVRVWKRSS